ncbi:winged helix-turn-helix domain-containing protein [Saccharothrix longispora]|uniref:winged helix-turn-helix domain-containing protein n=1 Tax=Saccharothrix longispora TaxID=33920 RepID=UPI0028FCFE71|nr:winged helix-turn-helix domain-containing protein [Saccharothrix longispora]MDU0288843.1 winged helix-turn-helix domain-containing protein [Saccharothrix longispora]
MTVDIRVLGEVGAVSDGRTLDVGPPRQRCVLAALAVDAGRVVPVDRLVARVWGEAPPYRARTLLVGYVSRLRRVLRSGGADVVRQAGGYALVVEASEVDLHRFRARRARARRRDDRTVAVLLAEAVAQWRGAALEGLRGEWADAARDRLHREREDVERELADVRLRLGQRFRLGFGLDGELVAGPPEPDPRPADVDLSLLDEVGSRRLVDARLRTALAADRALDPHRPPVDAGPAEQAEPAEPPSDAHAWFAAEHAVLLAAQRLAVDRGWHEPAWRLAWAMDTFHARRGHDAADDLARTLALAERVGDDTARAHLHLALARTWNDRGHPEVALEHATEALQRVGSPLAHAYALVAVGVAEAGAGRFDRAQVHCEAALALAHEHPGVAAVAHDGLGRTADLAGDHAAAVRHHEHAASLHRDSCWAPVALERLAHAHRAAGHLNQARAAWRRAVDLYLAQRSERDARRARRWLAALG